MSERRSRRTTLDFFASQLRRARREAGMTQEQLGRAANYAPSTIAEIETPNPATRKRPSLQFAQAMDAALPNANKIFTQILEELLAHDVEPEWFTEWRDIEESATALRWYESVVIPGLLQTEEYLRAALRVYLPRADDDEFEEQVATRVQRRDTLDRKELTLVAIIDEAALRRPVCGPKAMREQLRHLIDVTESGRATVHVLPLSVGAHRGLSGPFVLATVHGREVVYVDTQIKGLLVEGREAIEDVWRTWDTLIAEALPRAASIEFIREVAEEWNAD